MVKEEERRRRSSRRCSKRFKEYVEKLFVKVVKDCNNIGSINVATIIDFVITMITNRGGIKEKERKE